MTEIKKRNKERKNLMEAGGQINVYFWDNPGSASWRAIT